MKISDWGRVLLSGASLAAMGAGAAYAQEATPSEEIVVTATGRAAAIQDVPLAVTGLTGEALEDAGVQDLTDIDQLVPSFRIYAGQSTTAGTVARIRGVATGSDNPGFESAVGIFIDGVYRARPGLALGDLPELQRVEVLRGPQGTLFGRNTTAGAISIVTAGPGFDPGAWLELGGGDIGYGSVRAGGQLPLVEDHLAGRLDVSYRKRDGYITDTISGNDINTTDRWSARGQLQFDMANDASLRIIVDGGETDEVCCGVTPIAYGATGPALQAIAGAAAVQTIDLEARKMTVTPGRNYAETTNEFGVSGQFDGTLAGANFTWIGSIRDWEAHRNQDVDFNLIDIAYRDGLEIRFDTWTQEFRLQGENGRLDWLVGAFFGNEKLETTDRIRVGSAVNAYINALTMGNTATAVLGPVTGPFQWFDTTAGDDDSPPPGPLDPVESLLYAIGLARPAGLGGPTTAGENLYLAPSAAGAGQQADRWNQNTQTIALFTHNEISLTDNLIFTLGLRYNYESKDLKAVLNAVNPTCDSLRAHDVTTDAAFPGAGGLVAFGLLTPFAQLENLACNPAVNPIANGAWADRNHYNELSGITSLAYHFSDDMMGYASYSHGYKGGGWNLDRSGFAITPATLSSNALNTRQLQFNPELVDSYEVGLKTQFGRTTFNIDYFMEQITDFQLNAFNGFNFITRNIPDSVSKGVEVDFSTRLTDSLSVNGGLVWNDAYYDSTVDFNPLVAGSDIVAGQKVAQAPEWAVTGSVSWEHPIGNMLLNAYLDARYNSEYATQTLSRDPLGRTDQEAYTILNGHVGIGDQDNKWSLEVWGRNLTDEYYFVGTFEATLQSGTYLAYPNEPRTWGVTLRARY